MKLWLQHVSGTVALHAGCSLLPPAEAQKKSSKKRMRRNDHTRTKDQQRSRIRCKEKAQHVTGEMPENTLSGES